MADPSLTGKSDTAIAHHQFGNLEFIRSNQYSNLSEIAKPLGKRVDNWTRLESTKALLEAFEEDPAYRGILPFIDRNLRSEGTGKFVAGGGLYAHPDIAVQFAQWCSPKFALWVSRQIRHLMEHGEVNLHHREWTTEQYIQGMELNRDDDELRSISNKIAQELGTAQWIEGTHIIAKYISDN